MFALICASFISVISFYVLLRRLRHLFDPFSAIYMYLCTIFFSFESVIGMPTFFLF
jgi:hypothetical protein